MGDPAVGKTSLVLRYVKQSFSTEYISTIGAVVYKKQIELKDVMVDLIVWDIAGQETFDGIRLAFFRGCEGAFIASDSSRDETYLHLDDWVNSLYRVQKGVPIIFLANKIDLVNNSKTIEEKMKTIADKYKTEYFLTSAKDGTNVENAFSLLSQKIVKLLFQK